MHTAVATTKTCSTTSSNKKRNNHSNTSLCFNNSCCYNYFTVITTSFLLLHILFVFPSGTGGGHYQLVQAASAPAYYHHRHRHRHRQVRSTTNKSNNSSSSSSSNKSSSSQTQGNPGIFTSIITRRRRKRMAPITTNAEDSAAAAVNSGGGGGSESITITNPTTTTASSSPTSRIRRLSANIRTRSSQLANELKQPLPRSNQPELLPQPQHNVYVYSSLIAGVGSGAVSSVLCAPLDLIRVRMQVWGQVLREQHGAAAATVNTAAASNKAIKATTTNEDGAIKLIGRIVKEIRSREGPKGFFRGLGATLLTVPAFWGVYFPLYDDTKRKLSLRYPDINPSWVHMGSAVFAGVISDIICNPMFVVRTRLQTEALHNMAELTGKNGGAASGSKLVPKSIIETASALYKEGGIPIFWRGMTANLLGLSHVAVQFPVYEKLKKFFRSEKLHESATDLLLASSLSKMSASLLTYPHEVIRSRMMDARAAKVGFIHTCRLIYSTEGMLGFYAGLPVSLVRVLPNTCVTFITYELILRWSRSKMQEERQQEHEQQ